MTIKATFFAFAAASIALSQLLGASGAIHAESLSDLQSRQADLQAQIDDFVKQKQQAEGEADKIAAQLANLNIRVAQTNAKILSAQASLAALSVLIENTSSQIALKETEITIQKQNQDEVVRQLYELAGRSNLELVFSANTFSSLMDQRQAIETLVQKVEASIDALAKAKIALEATKELLERQQAEAAALKAQQDALKANLLGEQAVQNQLLTKTKKAIDEYQKRIENVERERLSISNVVARLFAEQNAQGGSQRFANGNLQVVNSAPHFYQQAPPWGPRYIYEDTMAQSGCLITAVTMIYNHEGILLNPGQMLDGLQQNGYLSGDYYMWGAVSGLANGRLKLGNDPFAGAVWPTANQALDNGRWVLAHLTIGHWVVLTGRAGDKYTVNDPYFSAGSKYPADLVDRLVTIVPN